MNAVGLDLPVFADIQTHVIDAGKAAGDGSNLGSVLYTRGMYAAMLAAEAIKTAQEMHGVSAITPMQMRDGMEALEMTAAKMEALGAPGIGPEFSVSCSDHGGSGKGLVQQWDAAAGKWAPLTEYLTPDAEVIDALVMEDSMAFAAENNIEPGC